MVQQLISKFFPIICFLLPVVTMQTFAQCSKADVDKLRKKALIIGESDYSIDKLPHAKNDAIDVAAMFKHIGFDTELDTNSKLSPLRNHITKWIEKLRDVDVAVFYFAGHGGQVGDENYLYPISATGSNNLNTIKAQTIMASYIKDQMETINKNINIIILDACRDDPTRNFASPHAWKNGLAPC